MDDVPLKEMSTGELAHLRNRIDHELEERRALAAVADPDALDDDEVDDLEEE